MKANLVKSSKWTLGLAALASLAACQQNPFPDSSKGTIVQEQIDPTVVVPAYSVEMPATLDCEEATYCSIPVVPHVPEGGTPSIRFEGLPADVHYDETKQELQWTPSYDYIDIAAHPTEPSKTAQGAVLITSSATPQLVYRRVFNYTVKNKYRPVTVTVTGSQRIIEGQTVTQEVEVKTDDFPNGPFIFNVVDGPKSDVSVAQGARGNLFTVSYTPNRSTVRTSDPVENGENVKKFPVKYTFSTASGLTAEKTAEWTVVDERAYPLVSYPVETTQGPEVNFTIRAEDPNNERAPVIQVSSSVPFGRLRWTEESVSPARPGQLPVRLYAVRWDEIPLNRMGQTANIQFQVCGPSSATQDLMCKNFATKVNLVGNTHLAPLVERPAWPIASMQYAKVGSELELPLPIADAETRTNPVEVKIVPAAMESVVSWADGKLKIKPTAIGLQSFSVVATSIFHKTTTEGFVFEAFPADRSDWAIVTDATFSKEVTELQRVLGGGDVLSSIFQTDERSLALRKIIVVTTTALANAQALPFVEKLATAKPNLLLLASPIMNKSAAFMSELKALGISLDARLPSVANRTFSVESPDLQALQRPAGLNGTLTAESKKPQTLEISVPGKCDSLLSLQKTGSADEDLVAVVCERAQGGKIAAFGFEPGDLMLAPQDAGIMKAWLEKLSQ